MALDKDELLAAALAAGKTWEEAGKAVGVSRTTVARRMSDPRFRGIVASFRRNSVDEALAKLAAGMIDAAAQLHLLATNSESETIKLHASKALLDVGLRYLSHVDLEDRIRALEAQVKGDDEPWKQGRAGWAEDDADD